ncbi:MAG: hypothetical protein MK028_03075 [Dehalococcoidia bacterium]|nr:hypothetical protein [Chloroflexota bacterium]MCH2525300.1 hypothetical protein [Dehalococcoidia bacterium]MQG00111.1 hypothetical protein [SAR202 cluster bacterium]|tara:strand:- start:7788 stop:8519 length:732 start_codon:yes stop_codon:yes gene_type:complete
MNLNFEIGSDDKPKGHALVFFRKKDDINQILATYIITLPLNVDVSKYVPPMFAPQMQNLSAQDLSCFAFPPVPEEVDGLDILRDLSQSRGDDLIDGGLCDTGDPMSLFQIVNDIQQEYSRLYQDRISSDVQEASASINSVLYEFMSDADRLRELSKLIGKLRFASEGYDSSLRREAEEEIESISVYMPENFNIPKIAEAASMSNSVGDNLAQLYLERCYRMRDEDYRGVQKIDDEIRSIEENL